MKNIDEERNRLVEESEMEMYNYFQKELLRKISEAQRLYSEGNNEAYLREISSAKSDLGVYLSTHELKSKNVNERISRLKNIVDAVEALGCALK